MTITDRTVRKLAPGVRDAIAALVAEHSWLIDHGEADRIAELFTEDGQMFGVGPDLIGLDAIRAWSVTRAAMHERTSRHVCTNLRLQQISDDEVHGTVILTVYRRDGPGPGKATPLLVGDYDDIYRRVADETWRFARRRVTLAFEGG